MIKNISVILVITILVGVGILHFSTPHRHAERDIDTISRPETPTHRTSTIKRGDDYALANVFYATDRKRTSSDLPREQFGPSRGPLEYGICQVSVPFKREAGELNRPWFHDWFEKPKKHFVLVKITPKPEETFLTEFSSVVDQSDDASALVFVHGFNVTFADAAYRSAQLAADLDFKGAVAFFSWPSNGGVLSYGSDIEDIRFAKPHIQQFLKQLVTQTRAKRIHVIAHSLGTRGVTEALSELLPSLSEEKQTAFNQIILTASDIDAEVFRDQIAPKIVSNNGPRITVYASSIDWPLKYSQHQSENQRLGQIKDNRPYPIKGIEAIDATEAIQSCMGHSYLFDERVLITDLKLVLKGDSADNRPGLTKRTVDGYQFWGIKP